MARTKRRIFVEQLPPTPCTTEMRERMLAVADRKGLSIAEIQRNAFSLFLSQHDTKSINDETLSFREEQTA